MGSAALGLAYVGNGRFDAFVQQSGLSTWDVAAAGLIAERAGATVTAMDGGPWFDLARKSGPSVRSRRRRRTTRRYWGWRSRSARAAV